MKIIVKCLECHSSWQQEDDTVYKCPFCHSVVIYELPKKMSMEL